MAKLLRMSRFVKGSGALSPANESAFPRFGRKDRKHCLASPTPEPSTGVPEQRLSLRFSIGAEARLLLVIGVVCGLLIHEGSKRSSVAGLKTSEQFQIKTTPEPAPTLAQPVPIVAARSVRVTATKAASSAVSRPAPHYSPVRYEATRKKVFGGCTGQLELSGSGLVFHCPDKADLFFPVATIAKTDKEGIVLKSGEKYHFLVANHTRGQVEEIFTSWLNRVEQLPPEEGMSSLRR